MRHKHLFKKYFIPSLLFLIGLVIGFFVLRLIDTSFRIRTVEVFGASLEERKTLLKLCKGLSTLTTQQTEIKNIVHTRFPTMEIQESKIQYPDTLVLVIQKEKPLAYLRTDYGYLTLSKKGIILMKERSREVPNPSISFYQTVHHSEYQMGQSIKFSAIDRALLFITLLRDLGYETETVAIDSIDMIACKTKGFEVAFSQTRPVDLQVHEVRQIVRQMRAGALRIARLDLRFDKPVVQLPKK